MEVVCTAALVLLSVQICFCQPSYPLPAAPSSVAVNTKNGEVFVAAGSQLLRLNNSLHLLENVTVGGGGELVVIALSPDGSRLVGCLGGDSRTCLVYDSQNLTSGETATVNNAHYNPENGLAIITTDESFYLGSEGKIQGEFEEAGNMLLAEYNYTSATVRTTGHISFSGDDIFDQYYDRSDIDPYYDRSDIDPYGPSLNQHFYDRHFYGGFSSNGYVYYFVSEIADIRVFRVCDCAQETCSCKFDALYNMSVKCPGAQASGTIRICGINLVEVSDDSVVLMTQCEDGDYSFFFFFVLFVIPAYFL